MSIVSGNFFLFCAVLLLLYYRVPGKMQWVVLLVASYLFYGCQGAQNLVYILFTTLTTYTVSLLLHYFQAQPDQKTGKQKGRLILLLCLTANFGMLLVCKINLLRGGLLPLGISFYLFQSMGYLLDVYRGKLNPERNLGKLALFVSFFPQLIQGPISRADKLLPQLTAVHAYDPRQVSFGLQRMLWGYFKKLVIAERIAPVVITLRNGDGSLLLLSILYAIQIYGDFTGGIDIVLGFSETLGIQLPENFIRPFFAKNTAEFWRRWHITLGEWMKDYVFYPISVSKPMRRLSKSARKRFGKYGKRIPVYAASLATWFATGIWHGLTPNFILWGMMNGTVIILSEELSPLYAKFHSRFPVKECRWYACFQMLRTFLLMNIIRIADLFPDVGAYVRRMGTIFSHPRVDCLEVRDGIILAVGVLLMLTVGLIQAKHGSVRGLLWRRNRLLGRSLFFFLFLAVLLMGCYGIGYDAGNFIYSAF